jgi:4-hydroxy-3-methylbut-2-en-1-yl diphosphate synthase IspG/GcpE
MTRNETRCIQVGAVKIGGDAPVSVQTMCNTKTHDVEATVRQIRAMRAAGTDPTTIPQSRLKAIFARFDLIDGAEQMSRDISRHREC